MVQKTGAMPSAAPTPPKSERQQRVARVEHDGAHADRLAPRGPRVRSRR